VSCEPVTSRPNGRFPKLSLSSNLENQPTKLHHTDPSACSLSSRNYLRNFFLTRLQPLLHEQRTIPDHQFGFRQKHATIEQVHPVTNAITEALENHKYCTAAFLDISQAFDRVWHEGLICKLRPLFPATTHKLLRSYLEHRYFQIKYREAYSPLHPVLFGVPQGSVLVPSSISCALLTYLLRMTAVLQLLLMTLSS